MAPRPPEIPADIERELKDLCQQLDRRCSLVGILDRYREGDSPLPPAITQAGVTKAYRMLMPVSEAPWASLVVDSTMDRLEPDGIATGTKTMDKAIWDVWQSNSMDSESKLAHDAALVHGRANALVWPKEGEDVPQISLDGADTTVIRYAQGSRRQRVSALRRWIGDDKKPYATMYLPDQIFKFIGPKDSSGTGETTKWTPRMVDGEDWPMTNKFGVVPWVEIAVNRRLKPGSFPYARGEFTHCTGLIDRINLLTFLGLVVAFWMGFPLRGTIGEKIRTEVLTDDKGEPIIDARSGKPKARAVPPFDAMAPGIFQLENPDAKVAEYTAADRRNLSVFAELDQLATITKTPRHYFPMETGMSNLSADAIRASEGSLHAKVTGYKASLGEGWEEVLRLCGQMSKESIEVPPTAELQWKDHESRSMAERADAASKVKDLFPWQLVAAKFLDMSQSEIDTIATQRGGDVIGQLAAAATAQPVQVAVNAPVPANGQPSTGG